MKLIPLAFCSLFFAATTVNAFELSDITDRIFKDNATGIEGKLKDAAFEFKVETALLRNETLRNETHIVVLRNRGSVLIAGQAATQELKDKVQRLVLSEAHLQWRQGDVNHVEPSNAQVCGKKASKMAANDRRKFNLKAAKECSTVNRFYNEVRVSTPMSEIERSDDDVLRATISNKLLHAKIIKKADTIKILVSDKHVYLLGDELDQSTAQRATTFVNDMLAVEKVVPLFRF
ncbi:MAG: transport-associated protein [Cycloclasticus sp. symbiont of Bathymodiolus heckerae]|nr:MAG: transport-associated protein [Cycloclasticus sp. symbiont of Bathymodiolus heckerae]